MKNQFHPVVSFKPFRLSVLQFHHINYLLLLLLIPATVQSLSLYGMYAARIIGTAVGSCILWDTLFGRIFGKPAGIYDGNAAVTGLLLAMLFPPFAPWWIVAVAAAAAMFLGKQLFGGTGASPFNAVCLGWAVVTISWSGIMDPSYGSVGLQLPFSIAYPLAELRFHGNTILENFPTLALLTGKQAGYIFSGATLSLVITGCIGIAFRIIPWRIPISFLAGIAGTACVIAIAGLPQSGTPLFHLCTGLSIPGAFFLASDFSSRPVSPSVMIIYGVIAGALTVLFRTWSIFPEGLPFALLVVNIIVPLIDRGRSRKKTHLPEVVHL